MIFFQFTWPGDGQNGNNTIGFLIISLTLTWSAGTQGFPESAKSSYVKATLVRYGIFLLTNCQWRVSHAELTGTQVPGFKNVRRFLGVGFVLKGRNKLQVLRVRSRSYISQGSSAISLDKPKPEGLYNECRQIAIYSHMQKDSVPSFSCIFFVMIRCAYIPVSYQTRCRGLIRPIEFQGQTDNKYILNIQPFIPSALFVYVRKQPRCTPPLASTIVVTSHLHVDICKNTWSDNNQKSGNISCTP